ncbi:MAG: FAD-dependent oxidoreductase [Chlorobiota bacterium]|nr:MAG: FAD-dependent oxidoreductase [Chlorobiota bacterium]
MNAIIPLDSRCWEQITQQLFGGCSDFCGMDSVANKPRCIVIGAGVAGIAAAVEATLLGMSVVLVEAHRYVGGRARSFRDELTGDELDNGQHVAMGCYQNLRHILRELGTESLLAPNDPVPIVFASARGERDVFNPYRWSGRLGVADGLLRLQSFSLAERLRLLIGGICASLGADREMTASDVLRACRQSESLIERFWEPLVLATLNAPVSIADGALLRAVLQRAIFGGGDSHYLLVPRAGLSKLWQPLERWLTERGGTIRLGTRAEDLVWLDDRVIGVATSTGEEIRGAAVIAAVPPKAYVRLLPQRYRSTVAFLAQLETMPIVSVYLWYDRPLVIPPVVGLWGTTAQWVFDRAAFLERSDDQQQRYPGHIEVTISAAHALAQQPTDAIVAHVNRELCTVFPQMKKARLLHWRVIKERSATPLLTPKTSRLRLSASSGIAGLYVAGDWTATGLPATLEGAAASGIAAARAAAQMA